MPSPIVAPLPSSVSDYEPDFAESFDEVCTALGNLSVKLRDLLPDPSIGPEERLERLARVVRHSVMDSRRHLTARTKLRHLRDRLDELVAGPATHEQKIDLLLQALDEQVPNAGHLTTFQKLEALGDARLSDIGRSGLPHNVIADLRGLYPDSGASLSWTIERAIGELLHLRALGH